MEEEISFSFFFIPDLMIGKGSLNIDGDVVAFGEGSGIEGYSG